MPLPFPGMNPYLEDRALWPDVYHRLISVISEFLSPPRGVQSRFAMRRRVRT